MDVRRIPLAEDAALYGMSVVKEDYVYNHTYPIHCHEFDELFFVFKGRAMHNINGRHQIVEKGSLGFIRPDDVHYYLPQNDYDFSLFSLGFSPEITKSALSYLGLEIGNEILPPYRTVYGADFTWLENRMEQLRLTHSPERLRLFRAFLPIVLEMLLGEGNGKASSALLIPPWLAKLEESMRIRENYVAGLERLLELCPYSQEYLNRMFRLYLKTTPTEYINTLRMAYATELLVSGRHSITEICFASGFNNLSYFYTVFHRMYGCTPKEFAKRMAGVETGVFR